MNAQKINQKRETDQSDAASQINIIEGEWADIIVHLVQSILSFRQTSATDRQKHYSCND